MSATFEELVEGLKAKLSGGFEKPVKIVVEGYPPLLVDQSGVRQEDGEAVVTLTADSDTFASILSGETNAAMAVMSGQVKLEGDMSTAMTLNAALSQG